MFSCTKCCTVNRQPTNPYLLFPQYLPLSPVLHKTRTVHEDIHNNVQRLDPSQKWHWLSWRHTQTAPLSLQAKICLAHERFCGATVRVALKRSTVYDRVSGASACVCGATPFPFWAPLLQVVFGVSAFVGYYAALIGTFVPTFRDSISVPSSRVFGCFTVEDGPDPSTLKMKRIHCPKTSVNKHQRCITSQKREGLIHIAEEAWNHPKLSSMCYCARNYGRRKSTNSGQLPCLIRDGKVAYFTPY